MSRTLEELKERLASTIDETTILEILEIKAEDLLNRFEDRLDERFDDLCRDAFPEEESEEADSV